MFVSFVFSSCLTNHREQIAKPLQGVEDFYSIPVVNTIRDEHVSDSETIADDNHLFHIYGDIKWVLFLRFTLPTLSYNCEQLMPCSPDNLRYAPLLDFSGTVFNCDKDLLSFDVNAEQYLSFYKSHRALPTLLIRATLDAMRYKNKKPLPSNNSIVSVLGLITHIDINEDTGLPLLFHVVVDHIGFLGKSSVPARNQGMFGFLSVFL